MITAQRQRRRSLGLVSTLVRGSLEYGSSPVPAGTTFRASSNPPPKTIGPAQPRIWTPVAPIVPISPLPPIVGPDPVWTGGGGSWQNGGGQYQPGGGGWRGGGYPNPNNPTSENNLAQLTLQYQSNPNSLTSAQWDQLQAAGVIAGTVPYSNASLVNPSSPFSSSSGIDPNTGLPYAEELAAAQAATISPTTAAGTGISTDLSTPYAGIPLYIWLGGGVLLFVLMSGKRR